MNSVGHVFNVPISRDFEHVENVLHENFTSSDRRVKRLAAVTTRGDLGGEEK